MDKFVKPWLHAVNRVYNFVIYAMAVTAGLAVIATFVAIVVDVSMRNLGISSPPWTSALSEYSMLILAMGIAPLLIRERGHVWVELLTSFTGEKFQRWSGLIVIICCIAVCTIMAWYSYVMAVEAAARAEVDIRSIILPRSFLYVVLAVGFTFCSSEFFRFLLFRQNMYTGHSQESSS